jgi:hypothetical protein
LQQVAQVAAEENCNQNGGADYGNCQEGLKGGLCDELNGDDRPIRGSQ